MSLNPYESPREVSAQRVPLPGPISMAGKISWDDARHALQLAMTPGRWIGRGRYSAGSVAVVLVLCFLIALAPVFAAPRDAGSYVLLPVAIVVATVALHRRWMLHYDWVRKQGVFGTVERWITEEGLQRMTQDGWTMTPWTEFSRIRVSDRVLLLFTRSTMSYLIFPRALFASEGDWQAVVLFLRDRLSED
jgi:hypothetical protein